MQKVYLVSEGEYDGYGVVGVCSEQTKAEQLKLLYATDNDIKEIVLDEVPDHPDGCLLWSVEMDSKGNSRRVRQESISCRQDENGEIKFWLQSNDGKRGHCCFFVWAKTGKDAIVAANEKRKELLENGTWPIQTQLVDADFLNDKEEECEDGEESSSSTSSQSEEDE